MTPVPTAPPPERAHALLSASGAHKWLHCTPSARLEHTLPDTTSEHASLGTLTHSIGELKLRKKFIGTMKTSEYSKALKELQKHPLYEPEILRWTDVYVDYVSKVIHKFNSKPYIALERRLNYSHIAPEGFGTCDCLIIGENILHVIDYKNGTGVLVSAVENPQMRLYALGALREFSLLYDIKTIRMTIVQPRRDTISEDEITVNELITWGESIKPIAQAAFEGAGEFCPGEWCKDGFCRAFATCRAVKDKHLNLMQFGGLLPPLISNEEIGQVLEKAQQLAAWVKKLENYALSQLLQGDSIPGWKAVEGRSAGRQFKDLDAAFKVLTENDYDESLLYERKPLTPAAIERDVVKSKKKFKELLNTFIETPPGKPALAPESDKRQPYKNQITAAEAFAAEGDNQNGKQ